MWATALTEPDLSLQLRSRLTMGKSFLSLNHYVVGGSRN